MRSEGSRLFIPQIRNVDHRLICFSAPFTELWYRHQDGQRGSEAAPGDGEEDRRAEGVPEQAQRVPARLPPAGEQPAHARPVRQQVRHATQRNSQVHPPKAPQPEQKQTDENPRLHRRFNETRNAEHMPQQSGLVAAHHLQSDQLEAGLPIRQPLQGDPAGVLRPQTLGHFRFIQERDQFGTERYQHPQRIRAQFESESNFRRVAAHRAVSAFENFEAGGELLADNKHQFEDPHRFENIQFGAGG